MAQGTALRMLHEHHQDAMKNGTPPDWAELDAALASIAPVAAPRNADMPRLTNEARNALESGGGFDEHGALLLDIWALGSEVASHAVDGAQRRCCGDDRVYVLEFQGPRQLVMFGRTTKLPARLRTHRSNAETFGYALLNGWASPGVARGRDLEITCLAFGRELHGGGPARERFFDMPYEQALRIARAAFVHHVQTPPCDERGLY